MAEVGVVGMAVMGQNLARNLARSGYAVAVQNRTIEKTRALLDAHGDEGDFTYAETLADLVEVLERPRRIISMVKAGRGTDAVVEELTGLLDDGDVVVDGGNAHFADTRRREAALAEHGIHLVGAGISGGEEGALHGPSIMPGGTDHAYEQVGSILEDIAAQVDGVPCCTHLGPDGVGHYVKMVHNGIEYADMQLIAEAYDLLRHGAGMTTDELAGVFREWNDGDLASFLIEITAEILRRTDERTGQPLVDVILDEAEQKGTGRWTAQLGLEHGVAITAIAEAVMARTLSSDKALRERAASRLAGPSPSGDLDRDGLVDDVRDALYAAKIVVYSQGFEQLAAASEEHEWGLDLGSVARIWRGGCIIRARFLDSIRKAYDDQPDLRTLVLADYFADAAGDAQPALRRMVTRATDQGIGTPAMSSALAYYDGLRRARVPANLLQAQRDYFGAHTYRRTDVEGSFHTRWTGDGAEVPADG